MIQDYTWISDRIFETRIKARNRNFTVVGVYAPVEGKEQDTEEFYTELQQSMDKIHKTQILFLHEILMEEYVIIQFQNV
jgi:hypothetical protein